MKPSAALFLTLTLAAGLVMADGPEAKVAGAPSAAAARAERLRRDWRLIEELVEGGLKLASQDDPVRRAEQCGRLARGVATEIRQAVDARERARAGDLGLHLHALLARGVAANLSFARTKLPPDSPRHEDLRRVLKDAFAVADPLREHLHEISPKERESFQPLPSAVDEGHGALRKALPPDPPAKAPQQAPPAPPAGKKLVPKG